MAATYVLTPSVIHALGPAGYGTWSLIASLTGYINLLALGVPMACVRYLAGHVAEGDARQMNKVIGSCAGLYLLMGAAALVIGAGAAPPVRLHDIPPALRGQAGLPSRLTVP